MARSKAGYSMMEMLMVLAITTFFVTAVFGLLSGGQASFFNAETSLDMRNSLRNAIEKMSLELRNTGYKSGVAQFSILSGQGINGTDIVRFSIPVLCTANSILLGVNGLPAYWGAPLTWGCDNSTCMDANNDCTVQEYKYVQYYINGSSQLERDVLNSNLQVVSGGTSILGMNIIGFNASLSGTEITLSITGQKTSLVGKVWSMSYTNKVLINNLSG